MLKMQTIEIIPHADNSVCYQFLCIEGKKSQSEIAQVQG